MIWVKKEMPAATAASTRGEVVCGSRRSMEKKIESQYDYEDNNDVPTDDHKNEVKHPMASCSWYPDPRGRLRP